MVGTADDEPPDVVVAPRNKKSLFKKPTWTKPTGEEDEEEGVDLFSRAKSLYPMRVAEEERKRQKKLERIERKRSTENTETKQSITSDLKKRRIYSQAGIHFSRNSPIYEQNDNALTGSAVRQSSPSSQGSASSQQRPQAYPTTVLEHYSRDVNTKKEATNKAIPRNPGIISLMSDGEDEAEEQNLSTLKKSTSQPISVEDEDEYTFDRDTTPTPVPSEDNEPISDEEFPELVQKARQREQQRALKRENAEKPFGEQDYYSNSGSTSFDPHEDLFQDLNTPAVDPVVEILITSVISNSKPMIFKRKISQSFKLIRMSWVDRQIPGPPELKAMIFLTWRGKRLYDVGNCEFLGLKAGIDGKVTSTDNSLDEHGRLHLEAWTEELYMEHQKRLLQENGGEQVAQQEGQQVEKIRLILKAKDMVEPLKVKVMPTTSIQKLINSVGNSQDVPAGKNVVLFFDGERLDPDSTVADVELSDLDTVEIHYR